MKKQTDDMDARGLTKRDVIDGDTLTLVSYSGNRRRRISFSAYTSVVAKTKQERRLTGWILPSLDGDPPHEHVLADMLKTAANEKEKIENRKRHEEDQRIQRERSAAKKAARKAAWEARKAAKV